MSPIILFSQELILSGPCDMLVSVYSVKRLKIPTVSYIYVELLHYIAHTNQYLRGSWRKTTYHERGKRNEIFTIKRLIHYLGTGIPFYKLACFRIASRTSSSDRLGTR
jgi:hypothetical protein